MLYLLKLFLGELQNLKHDYCLAKKLNHNAENLHGSFPHGITMNILLQNTKNNMGSSLFSYSARDNNCQIFFFLFYNNGLSNLRNELFTKQSTGDLFSIDLH